MGGCVLLGYWGMCVWVGCGVVYLWGIGVCVLKGGGVDNFKNNGVVVLVGVWVYPQSAGRQGSTHLPNRPLQRVVGRLPGRPPRQLLVRGEEADG